uniref:T9SS type A sorting domain-containing protein n=1 Tax=candidate division WOR-3 bacterium TaxID=2052148 RepID=A0A7C4TDI0_UNCW3
MILSFVFFLISPEVPSDQGSISFFIRDVNNGYGIESNIEVYKGNEHISSLSTDETGHLLFSSLPGEYNFLFSAKDYQSIRTSFTIEKKKNLEVQVHLTPLSNKIELPPQELSELTKEGSTVLFYGYIVDKITGKPIKGTKVMAEPNYTRIESDENGYFYLLLPASDFSPELPPVRETITFEKEGYKRLNLNKYLIPGECLLKLTLEPGEGVLYFEDEQGIYSDKPEKMDKKEGCPDCKRKNYPEDKSELRALYLDPPPIIRVGTNCTGYNCTNVEVMSLETYVRSGIDDEWIASWHYNSLRAGSVPYRSYGTWYVYHPVSSNYDITNNTYCQVWNPDQYQSCINAAIYTSGIMIQYNDEVARSEYSAENNDCGCGDGYSGTGSTWPCISDNPCAGYSCYGHGRGMCQWGSQRWANNYNYSWYWINNHYYNPASRYLSTPMYITSAYPSPNNVAPTESFTIYVATYNGAEDDHPNIMIGASLYNGNYYSDPAHDKKVTINVGNDSEYRIFQVPAGTPYDTYDLLVALWFDVDENNQINSGDFPLYLVTYYDAIIISPVAIEEAPHLSKSPNYSFIISPNPVFSSGRLRFSIPDKENVSITLFDLCGRKLKTLLDDFLTPGVYERTFDFSEFPQSVYFIKLKTDNYEVIKKLVKLR